MGEGRPKLRIWLTMSAGSKKKRCTGKRLGKLFAQSLDVLRGGMMLGLERYQDFRVGGAIVRYCCRKIDSAGRQADVIQNPKSSVDGICWRMTPSI